MSRLNGMIWAAAVGTFAFSAGTALAMNPHTLTPGSSLVIQVEDVKDVTVQPPITSDQAVDAVEEANKEKMDKPVPNAMDEKGGEDMENEAVKKELE